MKKQFKKWIKRILFASIFALLLLLIFIFYANLTIENAAANKTFYDIEKIEANKVGVLLGTAKFETKGGINLYFKYRIEAAVALYKSGKIDFILVSGDNATRYYNEPKEIQEELLKLGVPKEKIFLDYAGFRTLDSVVRAKKVFNQSKFTIISQKFQNERAIYLAEKQGINAVGFNAKDVPKSYGFKTEFREYFARSKAVLDMIFNTKPKYLGEKIEIK